MKREFIRNVVDVDVDGLRGVNHYTIKAMYNEIREDGRGSYAAIVFELLDEFDYTWQEIERDGGICQVNEDLKEAYGEDCLR